MAEGNSEGSKMSIMRIVQVLIRESDREHPLTQQEILELLEKEYGMTVSRKSVSRNLNRLKEAGLPVMCREVRRIINGKESPLSLDWYWDHLLSQDELKILIDLLYFSHLPAQQVRQLTDKLKRIQSRTFNDGKGNIKNLPSSAKPAECGAELAILSKAMNQKKMISFYFDHYEADGKRHHGYTISGEAKLYRASPYQIIATDERYVLLCNLEGSEEISIFRVDLMSDISILDTPARLQTTLSGLAEGEKLSDWVYPWHGIYTGSPLPCSFEADWHLMSDIVNDFGKSARLVSARQNLVTVELTIQPEALKAWTLRHAPLVRVISPSFLKEEVKEAAEALHRLYGSS